MHSSQARAAVYAINMGMRGNISLPRSLQDLESHLGYCSQPMGASGKIQKFRLKDGIWRLIGAPPGAK